MAGGGTDGPGAAARAAQRHAAAAAPQVVHVGFHKTASTWLQNCVFPFVRELEFGQLDPVANALTRNLAFAADDAFLDDAFRAVLARYEQRSAHLLLSHEGISQELWGEESTGERNARRLAAVAPDAAVVLVTRNQPEMLRALYAQYVNEGGYGAFAAFLAGDVQGPPYDFRKLEYDRTVALYLELFGADRVWVAPYESLREAPDAFVAQLCSWIGAEPPPRVAQRRLNGSLSPAPLAALRAWNRLFRRSRFNAAPRVAALRGGRGVRRFLQTAVDPVARRVVPPAAERDARALALAASERYAESNARLAELCGHPLDRFGYPLPSAGASARRAAARPS